MTDQDNAKLFTVQNMIIMIHVGARAHLAFAFAFVMHLACIVFNGTRHTKRWQISANIKGNQR